MREIFGKEEFPRFKAIFSATRQSVKADFQFFRSESGKRMGVLQVVLPEPLLVSLGLYGSLAGNPS